MNSFEAYNSIKKRQRGAQGEVGGGGEEAAIKKEIKKEPQDDADRNVSAGVREDYDEENKKKAQQTGLRAGKLLELFEVQLVVVISIFLDLFTSTSSILLTYNIKSESGSSDTEDYKLAILRVLESLSSFVLIFFLLEVGTLMVVFKDKFFMHGGYLLDVAVVGLCSVNEIYSGGKEIRLLGFLRLWRLVRLVNSMLNVARSEHNDTKAILKLAQQKNKELQVEAVLLQDSLQRSIEARKSVELMLKGYKDEVETLSEGEQTNETKHAADGRKVI